MLFCNYDFTENWSCQHFSALNGNILRKKITTAYGFSFSPFGIFMLKIPKCNFKIPYKLQCSINLFLFLVWRQIIEQVVHVIMFSPNFLQTQSSHAHFENTTNFTLRKYTLSSLQFPNGFDLDGFFYSDCTIISSSELFFLFTKDFQK